MLRQQVLNQARLAGRVRRYHTWPMTLEQTIGEHSWQVMRIWYGLWGPMPPEVSTYILWHDAGELKTGDLPFPVKKQNGGLKSALDDLEHEAVKAMGGQLPSLPPELSIRVKVCDLIEMSEHGLVELAMGNTFAEPIFIDTRKAAFDLALKLPPADQTKIVAAYEAMIKAYGWVERMSEKRQHKLLGIA